MDVGFAVEEADAGASVADAVAGAPAGPVALVDRRWVGHTWALYRTLRDGRAPAATCTGVLRVEAAVRGDLVRVLTGATCTTPSVDEVARSLASVAPVQVVDAGPLVHAVPRDKASRETALAAVRAVDGEAERLRTAVKAQDSFFTTFLVSPYSRYVARWCARRGLTPNQVTCASLALAVAAALLCATGVRSGYVAGALLLQVSFVLDCVDGQLARYTLRFSGTGAWLDAVFDRVKEYVVFLGLAVGAARSDDQVWALAAAATAAQVVRHFLHFGFSRANQGSGGQTSVTTKVWARVDVVAGWSEGVRRLAVLPIGERWALISLTTALTTPRTVFVVLLAAGAFAFCYAAAGRVLRSRGAGPRPRSAEVLPPMLDLGPLGRTVGRWAPSGVGTLVAGAVATIPLVLVLLLVLGVDDAPGAWLVAASLWYAAWIGAAAAGPLSGRLDWVLAPVTRAAEYATILTVAVALGGSAAVPAAFGLVAACAYHHYDTVYRLDDLDGTDARTSLLAGGHEGRLVLVVLVAAIAPAALTGVLCVLAGALALLFLATSVRWWRSQGTARVSPRQAGSSPPLTIGEQP